MVETLRAKWFNGGMIKVKENGGYSTVSVTITADSEEELDRGYELYCKDYHPAGYSTTVIDKGLGEEGYFLKVWRLASCE